MLRLRAPALCTLLEEHLGDPWEVSILPNRSPGDTSQLCALMWNTARVQKPHAAR